MGMFLFDAGSSLFFPHPGCDMAHLLGCESFLWWHVAKPPVMRLYATPDRHMEGQVSVMAWSIDVMHQRRALYRTASALSMAGNASGVEQQLSLGRVTNEPWWW